MHRNDIDYGNTIIYKISCKDSLITDLYIGHTTDFTKRRKSHRHACSDPTTRVKLYTFIREHGGWQNWRMQIIAFHCCNDLLEARQKEQEYFISLGATLNSVEPCPIPQIAVNKVINVIEDTKVPIETARDDNLFVCKPCEYSCIAKQHYKQHCATTKHQLRITKQQTENKHICDVCMKMYIDRSGLWKHKKKCFAIENKDNGLAIENRELRNFITEQTKIFTNTVNMIMEKNTEFIAKLTENTPFL